MYTDNTLLELGEYRFRKLGGVPPRYLLDMHQRKTYFNAEIREYIESNLELIQARMEGREPILMPQILCVKVVYAKESDAKKQIKRISQRAQKNKKPVRCYECPTCGGWHLTSIPWEEWKLMH